MKDGITIMIGTKRIFYIFITILISYFGCQKNINKPKEEFEDIINMIDNYNHDEALINLEKLEKEQGNDFNFLGINIPLLKFVCYDAKGDFSSAKIEYDNFLALGNKDLSEEVLGFGLYDSIFFKSFIKAYKFEEATNLLKEYFNFEEMITNYDETDSNLIGVSGLKRSIELSRIIIIQVLYNEGIIDDAQPLEHQVDYFFNYLISLNSEYQIWISFLELLDYKMIDSKYYSDYLWSNEITKQYFQEMVDKGLITGKTLDIIKEKVYRKDIPQDFLNLFEMVE